MVAPAHHMVKVEARIRIRCSQDVSKRTMAPSGAWFTARTMWLSQSFQQWDVCKEVLFRPYGTTCRNTRVAAGKLGRARILFHAHPQLCLREWPPEL